MAVPAGIARLRPGHFFRRAGKNGPVETARTGRGALLALARAQGQAEVDGALRGPFFKDVLWKPLGGTENNYAVVSNQQSSPVNALCEKPVNSIDHVLIKHCLLSGDRPAGRGAPASMSEALERYMGVPGGDIARLGAGRMRELAQNVRVVADGAKNSSPNIIVADRGEGQEPDKFETTLLSLQKGNKKRIKFVQGKYNMGGTGVLPFCGTRGYQLVAARRSARLQEGSEWGFTLIRERPGVSDKTPWYEYFTGPDGRICSVGGGALPLLPGGGALDDGCMVKMFCYEVPGQSIARKLWSDMNGVLYSPPLPVMVEDSRFRGSAHNPRIMYGNRNLLEREYSRHVHRSFSIKSRLRGFGTSRLDVTVFEHASRSPGGKNVTRELRPKSAAILLTQNGQTHAAFRQSRLDSEAGLASLAEYAMVHVDLTDLPPSKAKMFLASRDRMRQSADAKKLEERILEDVGEDGQVRALEAEYKKLDEQTSVKDTSMNRAIEEAVKKNKMLAEILAPGGTPADGKPWEGAGEDREGGGAGLRPSSYIPTYLRFKGGGVSGHKAVPSDGSAAYAVLETDAPDDYTTRRQDAGSLEVRFPPALGGSPHAPFGGRVKVKLSGEGEPSDDAGDVIVTLTRPRDSPLSCVIHAIFVEPKARKKRSGVALQSFRWVKKDGWAGLGWTARTVARAGKTEVLVNRNCEFLEQFQRHMPRSRAGEIAERFGLHVFFASVGLHSSHGDDANYDEIYEKSIEAVARSCLAASYGGARARPG